MIGVHRVALSSVSSSEGLGMLRILNTEQLRGYVFQRFFFFSGVPAGVHRGGHAHKSCRQLLIPLDDRVSIHFTNRFGEKETVKSEAGVAYLVETNIWVDINFLADHAQLVVAATEAFREEDYIRSLTDFLIE